MVTVYKKPIPTCGIEVDFCYARNTIAKSNRARHSKEVKRRMNKRFRKYLKIKTNEADF